MINLYQFISIYINAFFYTKRRSAYDPYIYKNINL